MQVISGKKTKRESKTYINQGKTFIDAYIRKKNAINYVLYKKKKTDRHNLNDKLYKSITLSLSLSLSKSARI